MTGGLERTPELLRLAHKALREIVMPDTRGDRRYSAAMIANALAIAAREMELKADAAEDERRRLSSFYNDSGESLAGLRSRLCHDLRRGALSADDKVRLRPLLVSAVIARLAVSNPGHRSRSGVRRSAN